MLLIYNMYICFWEICWENQAAATQPVLQVIECTKEGLISGVP